MSERWMHRGILAMDIEGFGDPRRSNSARIALRAVMYHVVEKALRDAGITAAHTDPPRDLGDGVLLLVHPEVSAATLLGRLVPALAGRLALASRDSSPATRLRLRAVVHAGTVCADAHGYSSDALNLAFRLLNSRAARVALRDAVGASLVVVVSQEVWRRVAGHRSAEAGLSGYRPVWVSEKETTTRAWIGRPGFAPARPPPARTSVGDDVRRRELLAYAGALFGNAGLDVVIGSRPVSPQDVEGAGGVTRRLRALGQTMPADRVYRALRGHAASLRRLARRGADGGVQRALLGVLAQTEAVAGWMATFDLKDRGRAERCFQSAMRAAAGAGDPLPAGAVCLKMADGALYGGRPREALEIANAGMGLVGSADPALRVALSTTVAQAHAALGEPAAAQAALDRAAVLVRDPAYRASPWAHMDLPRFEGDRGLVALRLGRLGDASLALEGAIAAAADDVGHCALLSVSLVDVLFRQGDPERAAAIGVESLDAIRPLGSKGRLELFSPVGPHLERYAGLPAVRELAGQLAAYGATQATSVTPS